jgi:hypothetical protein
MIRLSKSVISFGAVALVACVATLAVPRAAAAVAAKLVQVTNTAANPAITQSARNLASQLVHLTSSPPPQGVTTFVNAFSNQNVAYYVPAGQSLVVTAVDITPPPGCTSQPSPFELIDSGGLPTLIGRCPPLNTGHFECPSGIVFAAGSRPEILFGAGTCTNGAAALVNLFGYLTSE